MIQNLNTSKLLCDILNRNEVTVSAVEPATDTMGEHGHHQAVKARVVQLGYTLRKEGGVSVTGGGDSARGGASSCRRDR